MHRELSFHIKTKNIHMVSAILNSAPMITYERPKADWEWGGGANPPMIGTTYIVYIYIYIQIAIPPQGVGNLYYA